jgi:hypothetical protein
VKDVPQWLGPDILSIICGTVKAMPFLERVFHADCVCVSPQLAKPGEDETRDAML